MPTGCMNSPQPDAPGMSPGPQATADPRPPGWAHLRPSPGEGQLRRGRPSGEIVSATPGARSWAPGSCHIVHTCPEGTRRRQRLLRAETSAASSCSCTGSPTAFRADRWRPLISPPMARTTVCAMSGSPALRNPVRRGTGSVQAHPAGVTTGQDRGDVMETVSGGRGVQVWTRSGQWQSPAAAPDQVSPMAARRGRDDCDSEHR